MEAETLVVFHRCGGRSLGYPPNTLFTAQWARDYGAKAIEYDIVLCKDRSQYRIAVVEPKLLKQAGLDINDLDWRDVSAIDAGNEKFGYCNVVLLDEMLQEIDTTKVAHQVHIKGNNPNTLSVLLPKLHGVKNYVLTTFDISVIKQVRSMDGTVPVGWIVKPTQEKGNEGSEDLTAAVSGGNLPPYTGEELDNIVGEARANSVNVVVLCGPRVQQKETVHKVRDAGFEVGAWGVGTNLKLAKKLIEYQVDRFTIDNPEQL